MKLTALQSEVLYYLGSTTLSHPETPIRVTARNFAYSLFDPVPVLRALAKKGAAIESGSGSKWRPYSVWQITVAGRKALSEGSEP